ncbi:MFS transporter [Haloferax larsenii]|uniref:Predicted arabinose efflux permease, MFS family n=1 Tax=Haloferax larsenii TaxID=302484 RepID=A0A1H7UL46_HALLR|nr:MFS transporter [Haloferax larsenii]SEL97037.1 Predicted arabinose efflux permease, MFS family [Haloferax larsenii]
MSLESGASWRSRLVTAVVERWGISRSLAILSVSQAGASFGAGLIIPLLAPLVAGVESPMVPATVAGIRVTQEVQVGVFFAVFGVVRSAVQLPMGHFSDRIGARKPFVEAGLLVTAGVIYAYGITGSLGVLLSVRALHGVALAISTPALMALLERLTVGESRGSAMGFFSSLRTLGWGVAPIVGGAVADVYGLQATFTLGAVLIVAMVVVIRVGVPDVSTAVDEPDEDTIAVDSGRVFSSWSQARSFCGLVVAVITVMIGVSAVISMEMPILERIGGSKASFGLVFAITTITRLVVQIPVGRATDRYGRMVFIAAGLFLSAPLVALMGFAQTLWGFVALRALLGVALAGVIAPVYALAADLADAGRTGLQMGFVTTAFSIGFAVGPVVTGVLSTVGFAVPFVVTGGATAVAGVCVVVLVDG